MIEKSLSMSYLLGPDSDNIIHNSNLTQTTVGVNISSVSISQVHSTVKEAPGASLHSSRLQPLPFLSQQCFNSQTEGINMHR